MNSSSNHQAVTKFRCHKISSWQAPEDIKFSKKLYERFDPATLDDSQNVKIDYYRQPSMEPAQDPRDFRNMPKPLKEFKQAMLQISDTEWIRGEPPRYIFIGQIPSKQVKTDLNLYALLEDHLHISEIDIININLFTVSSETICASVLFASGFKAWELVRNFIRSPSGLNWTIQIDSGALQFERIKNHVTAKKEHRGEYREYNRESRRELYRETFRDSHRETFRDSHSRDSRDFHQLTCNPFVPCLKIPFSCESTLPFRLDKHILKSLFPLSRFPSFSDVEEGQSSWHCHFGREIDVVEADKMFLLDTLRWKHHEFYFHQWILNKNGIPWSIPDHYNKKDDKIKVIEVDAIEMPPPPSTQSSDDLFLKLPKFIKKRTLSDSSDDPVSLNDKIVKVKVKRKSLKKLPFEHPPPLPLILEDPFPEDSESILNKIEEEELVEIHEEIECPVLISGSVRTEGYFQLSKEEKNRVRFEGILEAFSSETMTNITSSTTASNVSNVDSRSSRAQNRRPLLIPSATNVMMDLFKVSPLQSAQKLVALRNSSIHSYGLVLMESADPGDLIIEYVGELVRASVANIREWKYEREYRGDGIASSYLFRLDEIMVIDASQQGNLARFINHSCDPNCVAKTITLNGSKRIVMYAKKGIRPGEEITYDYKFPTEKDPKKKVKCLCGSNSCRKYLN